MAAEINHMINLSKNSIDTMSNKAYMQWRRQGGRPPILQAKILAYV